MSSAVCRMLASRRGTAAIEFGLAIPLLLILLMGVVELGFAMYQAMQVYAAAEAGALYAAPNGWDESGISTAVTGATSTVGLTAPTPSRFWGCPDESGITTVASSGIKCAGNTSPGEYIQVNASLDHATILPYPGWPLPTTFTAKSIIRIN